MAKLDDATILDIVSKMAVGVASSSNLRNYFEEEFEWFNIGFAPRKNNITLYFTCYLDREPLVKKLGKCKYGK